MPKLIVTPVNMVSPYVTGFTKKARVDYKRELIYFDSDKKSPKWDDSKHNLAVVGDMFAFIHNIEDKAELFEIIEIRDAENRPDYWDMPEHRRRNVLILSKKIRDDTWSRFKEELHKPDWGILRGTTRTDWTELLFYDVNDVYV
jgi:hypothetical protein